MFHKKAQTFHGIVACECSERNETFAIVQDDIYTNTETKYKQRAYEFYWFFYVNTCSQQEEHSKSMYQQVIST
jgi:hypothetical protein